MSMNIENVANYAKFAHVLLKQAWYFCVLMYTYATDVIK